MPSYSDAVESLYALGAELAPASDNTQPRRKFELEHMRRLIEALGHPERDFRSILIAGTNGKGSTSATLASILTQAGYRTGLYTSPHLIRINERIRIDGTTISDDDFAEYYERVQKVGLELFEAGRLPAMPSFFETMTAIAFEYFRARQVEIAVLEVGLGGRLDATNVVNPLVSVITDIDLDHQQWLGETLTEIAREKAGILRQHGTVVLLPQHPEVNRALGEVAISLQCKAVNATEYMPSTAPAAAPDAAASGGYTVQWDTTPVTVASPLEGRHQWRNVALALAAVHELKSSFGFDKITSSSVEAGVQGTRWPGRLQHLRHDGHTYLFDVAHNPAGAWALRSALSQLRPSGVTLVFGAMQDKAIEEIGTILFPISDRVVLTRSHSPRAAEPSAIATIAANTGADFLLSNSVPEALALARQATSAEGLIVITGSVFVVGEALALLAPESAR